MHKTVHWLDLFASHPQRTLSASKVSLSPPLIHSPRNSGDSGRAIKDGEAIVRTVKVTDGQVNDIVGLRPCPSRKITATCGCGWVRAVTNGEETRIKPIGSCCRAHNVLHRGLQRKVGCVVGE